MQHKITHIYTAFVFFTTRICKNRIFQSINSPTKHTARIYFHLLVIFRLFWSFFHLKNVLISLRFNSFFDVFFRAFRRQAPRVYALSCSPRAFICLVCACFALKTGVQLTNNGAFCDFSSVFLCFFVNSRQKQYKNSF